MIRFLPFPDKVTGSARFIESVLLNLIIEGTHEVPMKET